MSRFSQRRARRSALDRTDERSRRQRDGRPEVARCKQQPTVPSSAVRRLRIEPLELRSLLAVETLVGSTWEQVWQGQSASWPDAGTDFAGQADLNGDGRLDLVLHHGQGTEVMLGQGNGAFGEGTLVHDVAGVSLIADIDNDGDQDLLSAADTELRVALNLGTGNGTWLGFQPQQVESLPLAGAAALHLVAADLNGDQRTDLAISTTAGVLVRHGTELNQLGAPIHYPLADGSQRRLIAGDIDRDGDLDLVSAMASYGDSKLEVLLNDGQGFFEPTQSNTVLKNQIQDLVAGDLDDDGDLDLVVAYNYSYDGNLGVMLNDGTGSFSAEPTPLTTAGPPRHLALGDVDADGDLDLAVAHASGGHIPYSGAPGLTVFLGQGNGRLVPRHYVLHADASAVQIGHLDETPTAEVTVVDWQGKVQVVRTVEPHLLPARLDLDGNLPAGSSAWAQVARGDWNDDGLSDTVYGIRTRLGGPFQEYVLRVQQADGSFVDTRLPFYDDILNWLFTDLTGDGRADLGLVPYNQNSLVVLPQTAEQQLGPPVETQLNGQWLFSYDRFDFNADDQPDLLTRNNDGELRILFGAGLGNFNLGPLVAQGHDVRPVELNDDSHPDLLVLSTTSLRTLLGQPDGTFIQTYRLPTTDGTYLHVWRDFTGDGHFDMLLVNSNDAHILTGRGDGTFQEAPGGNVGISGRNPWAKFPDMNLDGRADLVIWNKTEGRISTWLSQADGSLTTPIHTNVVRQLYSYLSQDLNGDQTLDFLMVSETRTAVYFGTENGAFVEPIPPLITAGIPSHVSAAEDHNGDGLHDLLIISSAGLRIWTLQTDGSYLEYFVLNLTPPNEYVRSSADINGDGRLDFTYGAEQRLFLSSQDVPYREVFAFGANSGNVIFSDVTGDGSPDAISSGGADPVTVWRNQGDGTFIPLPAPRTYGAVELIDVNHDARLDLLIYDSYSIGQLTAWLNVDGTHFTQHFAMPLNGDVSESLMAIGDLNQDGYDDIVIHWTVPGPGTRFAVLLSTTDGTLTQPVTYVFEKKPSHRGELILGDIDEDGDLDLKLEGDLQGGYNGGGIELSGVILNQADQSWPVGDSNRDGIFNSSDLVLALQRGEYEDDIVGNSTWIEGDWDRDGEFSTRDLVFAFQKGTYIAAALADARLADAAAQVPPRRTFVP